MHQHQRKTFAGDFVVGFDAVSSAIGHAITRELPRNGIHHEGTKDTKGSDYSDNLNSDLRALRVLRGENAFPFGCSLDALDPSW
jgi:hypothetical protein